MWEIFLCHILSTLNVISTTSPKCVACFEAARCGFPCSRSMGPKANRHENMSCVGGGLAFVSISWKLRAMKDELWNLNFETYHPLNHLTFRHVAWHAFRSPGSLNLRNISPLKHVTFWDLCFSPMHPSSMFSHALNLFQLSHASSSFHRTTLSWQLMKVME
jgi:hypothetical protein